jgi:hypothetical protein
MRKSRSAHVKCDCGNKNKCIHLQPTLDGHKDTCCCNHGGKCTCTPSESSQLETMPEAEKETGSRRRRANTTASEGASAPAPAPRHKTTTTKKRLSHKGAIARVNSATETMGSMQSSSSRDIPGRPRSSNSHHFESELSSPNMPTSPTFSHGLVPAPLDLSRMSYPYHSGTFDPFSGTGFSADHDAPLNSAGLVPPSDTWGTSDFSTFRMAHSFGSLIEYDRFPALASAGTTSGDASEVDENFMAGDEDGFPAPYRAHHNNGMFNHGQNSNLGRYMPTVGSFDDEMLALRYSNHTSNMPDSPEDYSGFDYPYHYNA